MLDTLKLKIFNAWRSRTIWAAALLSLFGVVESQVQLIGAYLPHQAYAWVMTACGVIMGFFRLITNEAIEEIGKLAHVADGDGTAGASAGASANSGQPGISGGSVNSGESGKP